MNNAFISVWWGSPDAAAAYRPESLSEDDRLRGGVSRSAHAQLEWQVSRVLKQCASGNGAQSISHSKGHAVLAAGPADVRIGVDLEFLKPRDVMALATWCCSDEEMNMLAALNTVARRDLFYALWTLKEAMVKAGGLNFPADMKSVGLTAQMRLRHPFGTQQWSAHTYRIDADWMVSVVWGGERSYLGDPQWFEGPSSPMPPHHLQWRFAPR